MLRRKELEIGKGMVWLSSLKKKKHEVTGCYVFILLDQG